MSALVHFITWILYQKRTILRCAALLLRFAAYFRTLCAPESQGR